MVTECCVPLCQNKGGFRFPMSRLDVLKAWIIAIKRDKWKPTKYSVVCKNHFTQDDFVEKTIYGTIPLRKILKPNAVPHIFQWTPVLTQAASARCDRMNKRKKMAQVLDNQHEMCWQEVGAVEEVTSEPNVPFPNELDSMTQMTDDTTTTECKDTECQTEAAGQFSYKDFMFDAKGMHFYTGLETYDQFMFVLSTLGPAAGELNYYYGFQPTLAIADQFFLTLIRLRQNESTFKLSRLFHISEKAVTNIFVTWINYMSLEWGEIEWWPSKDLVKYYSPTDFRSKFPTTRVIVDGTECPIQKPKNPICQQATFSQYKNCNTLKVLVGCTPGGLVSFISDAYGGSASDRQITERSSLVDKCESGDSVMSDKGFNVQDLFVCRNVTVNIPTFFKQKNRIAGDIVLRDRKIASKRVHIERIIGLAKTYKILKKPFTHTECALGSEIIKVCFYLCNFRTGIVPKNA